MIPTLTEICTNTYRLEQRRHSSASAQRVSLNETHAHTHVCVPVETFCSIEKKMSKISGIVLAVLRICEKDQCIIYFTFNNTFTLHFFRYDFSIVDSTSENNIVHTNEIMKQMII